VVQAALEAYTDGLIDELPEDAPSFDSHLRSSFARISLWLEIRCGGQLLAFGVTRHFCAARSTSAF
jgi:hypothetical protein